MKLSIQGTKIVFAFDGLEPLTFDRDQATSPEARQSAEMLGWSNKLRDAAALERKDKAGNVVNVTEQMRRDAVAPLIEHFHSGGMWAVRSARGPQQNATILAIAQKMGVDYATAETEVAKRMLAQFGVES